MIKRSSKAIIFSLLVCIPITVYFLSVLPSWGQPPPLDSMVIFRESTVYYFADAQEITETGTTIHPPLLYIVNGIAFLLLGKSPASYNFIGSLLFISFYVVFYRLVRRVFDSHVALFACALLFLHPFVIVHSFYLSNDFLILCGMIALAWSHITENRRAILLSLACLSLMKETALVIIAVYLCIRLMRTIMNARRSKSLTGLIPELAYVLVPVLVLLWWKFKLSTMGATEWRDPSYANSGNSFSVLYGIFASGNVLNSQLFQNLFHAFAFNFQWVFSGLACALSFRILKSVRKFSDKQIWLVAYFLSITLCYALFVFSFPTWTIPRYILPVLPVIYLVIGIGASQVQKRFVRYSLFVTGIILSVISLTASLDPVTRLVYPLESNESGTFYSIESTTSGPDGIAYNTQFLSILRRQNNLIQYAILSDVDSIVADCNQLKLGERIYSLNIYNRSYPGFHLNKPLDCVFLEELGNEEKSEKFIGKRLLIALPGEEPYVTGD